MIALMLSSFLLLQGKAEVKALGNAAKPAFGSAMKNKWIKTEKAAAGVVYKRIVRGAWDQQHVKAVCKEANVELTVCGDTRD